MSYFVFIKNVKWFRFLVPKETVKGLFSYYPRTGNHFIVCWDYNDSDDNKIKLYAAFPNYIDFVKYMLKIPKHLRCFYEIVIGEKYQKIHFDLDIDDVTKQNVLSELIEAIVKVLAEKGITLSLEKDVCIYSSNNEKKLSYHVIINSWCHANNKEAKSFYYAVMDKLPPDYFEKKWIDAAVYSKTQQFRTYGSCKSGTERFKILVQEWSFENQAIKHVSDEIGEDENQQFLIEFQESLVTARPGMCKIIPGFEIPDKYIKKNWDSVVDKKLAWEAITLLAHKAGITPEDPRFPYKFDRIEGSIIIMKRLKPSKCRVCNRIHHNENPYILIVPETNDVYFDCRRNKEKLYLGSLKSEPEPEKLVAKPHEEWAQNKIEKLKELAMMETKKPVIKKEDPELKKELMNTLLNLRQNRL